MDEQKLLRNLAKALGNENLLEELEQKKAKEAALLESMNSALTKLTMGEKLAPAPIVEETKVAAPELIVEIGRQPEPELPKKDIVTQSVIALSKTNQQDGSIQAVADEIPDVYRRELDIIKKSIADFHRFAQRHSQLGGGGAGDIVHLDHPTKTVYSNYAFTNKDYYIGAGATPITITLPAVAKNGRVIVVKDEVGNCSQNPITVHGTVDNDPGGLILAENNGGIQLIYNNGSWRII
jgi:hypothetical protein